jgi:hypothetical protein
MPPPSSVTFTEIELFPATSCDEIGLYAVSVEKSELRAFLPYLMIPLGLMQWQMNNRNDSLFRTHPVIEMKLVQ